MIIWLLNLIVGIIVIETIDFGMHYKEIHVKEIYYGLLLLFGWTMMNFFIKEICLVHLTIIAIFPLLIILGINVQDSHLKREVDTLKYDYEEQGKNNVFANKKVMLIVPHEDDDMNVASGIIEQYLKYGSDIYIVFATNGDYWNLGETRLKEALTVYKYYGVPENHIIFLGYADGWQNSHIYNSEKGKECKSRNGYTKTYGIDSHKAYNDSVPYTFDNYLNDIKNVILEFLPDIIICNDLDSHVEHKATSFFFEKAMGLVLKQKQNYKPVVLKSFAYCTSWTAPKDFYKVNLLSTTEPSKDDLLIYRWEDRIRLPISGGKLSRSLRNSELIEPISLYKSQKADMAARAIINGDKVYWLRRTDSILYKANIRVSSGEVHYLTDFMLLDSNDISDDKHKPFDSVWIPDKKDSLKTIWVSLDKPRDIDSIILYENPSTDDHISKVVITLDNGKIFEIDDIKACGTNILIHQKNVSGFSIVLVDTVGDRAGLTEIEAYEKPIISECSFVKMMDENENFVYDYIIDEIGTQKFKLYHCGKYEELNANTYSIVCDNDHCEALIEQSEIYVKCPVGQKCHIYLKSNVEGNLLDMITVRNPSLKERTQIMNFMRYEEFRNHDIQWLYKQTIVYNMKSKAKDTLRHIKHTLM